VSLGKSRATAADLSKVPTNILEQTLILIEQKSLAELKIIGSVKSK